MSISQERYAYWSQDQATFSWWFPPREYWGVMNKAIVNDGRHGADWHTHLLSTEAIRAGIGKRTWWQHDTVPGAPCPLLIWLSQRWFQYRDESKAYIFFLQFSLHIVSFKQTIDEYCMVVTEDFWPCRYSLSDTRQCIRKQFAFAYEEEAASKKASLICTTDPSQRFAHSLSPGTWLFWLSSTCSMHVQKHTHLHSI